MPPPPKGVSRGRFSAFTLAEVLITLAIIGVVAAMTIPSVIVRTNQQEYKTGAKKALSVLSSALQLAEAQDGISLENSDYEEIQNALEKYMNIIKTDYDGDENFVFYTADGFRYHMVGRKEFLVDVNGDKGPSTFDMSESEWPRADHNNSNDLYNPEWPNVKLTDVFVIYFYSDGRSEMTPLAWMPE